ncbi:MAG: hypothetical protein GX577_15590 [Leptolinea sp.]|nr:hypothetical protein [Leptolinea sp.]
MQSPIEPSSEESTRIQLDRDVLSAMLKAWLLPRTTGKLLNSNENKDEKIDQPFVDEKTEAA